MMVSAHATPTANPNLATLLFYTCVTKEVKNQCNESFTLDQAESANAGFTDNFTTIEQGHRVGMSSFFATHDIFFENGKGMRPDWEARWADASKKLAPLIEARKVVGFFLGDELLSGGKISVANLSTALKAVDALKKQYPTYNLVAWENEGGGKPTSRWVNYVNTELGGMLPPELDAFSIDDYSLDAAGHRQFYESTIYPMLHPHQSVFLVPGSYSTGHDRSQSEWCCGGDTAAACDACIVNRTAQFFAWAQEDTKVSGLAPWHWDNRGVDEVTPYKEIGTVDMPLTRAELQKSGASASLQLRIEQESCGARAIKHAGEQI